MSTFDMPALPTTEKGVTLWGAPGAGKSGLLGALYAASLRRGADGWSAHVKDCDDEYSQERLKEAYLGLLDRNNAKTGLPRGEYAPLRLTLRRARGRRSSAAMRVALVDPAGEFSTQLELGTTPEGRALFSRVARGGGVLWLFEAHDDRAEDATMRMLTLQHLVALLEQSGGVQLGIPVALCLSKVDCLPPSRREAAMRDPEGALRAHMGDAAFTWFEAVCPVKRCFTITSAGAATGPIQPEGLDDLFDWLASATRHQVTWRERLGSLLGGIPAARGMVGALAVALAGAAAAAGLATSGPHLPTRVARWTAPGASTTFTAPRVAEAPAPVAPAPPAVAPGEQSAGGEVVPRARGATKTETRYVPRALARDYSSREIASRAARRDAARDAAIDAASAEALFAEARAVARQGAWLAALRTLGDAVPPRTLRFAWDSLYLLSALEVAARSRDAAAAERLFADIHARATAVVDRGPPGGRRLVGVRYARAVACIDGRLDCPRRQVWEDLTWALLGPRTLRGQARTRLAMLAALDKDDARGAR